MTKPTDAVPAPGGDASPATCETGKAPATASDGEGKGGLPTISAAGRVANGTTCTRQCRVMQACDRRPRSRANLTKGDILGKRLRAASGGR